MHPEPDVQRLRHLAREIRDVFAALPYVSRVFVFGSIARGEADRWSDIDTLVVTHTREHFWQVFDTLRSSKPILYRSVFNPFVPPHGGNVLGNYFADEAIFHCLDLSFLTLEEFNQAGALDRFGTLAEWHNATQLPLLSPEKVDVLPEAETPDQVEVYTTIHFAKKALKKKLRGFPVDDELRKRVTYLQNTLSEYPEDYCVATGAIASIGHAYLKLSQQALTATDG